MRIHMGLCTGVIRAQLQLPNIGVKDWCRAISVNLFGVDVLCAYGPLESLFSLG
jgi:hypothetical protein